MHLHPDDVLLYHEIVAAMRRVALHYRLPLRDVRPEPCLNGGADYHAEGRARGRAAADRMTLGRRAVAGPATRGALGTGQ